MLDIAVSTFSNGGIMSSWFNVLMLLWNSLKWMLGSFVDMFQADVFKYVSLTLNSNVRRIKENTI